MRRKCHYIQKHIMSSMNLRQNTISGSCSIICSSMVYMEMFAYAGAIQVPIAVPCICI